MPAKGGAGRPCVIYPPYIRTGATGGRRRARVRRPRGRRRHHRPRHRLAGRAARAACRRRRPRTGRRGRPGRGRHARRRHRAALRRADPARPQLDSARRYPALRRRAGGGHAAWTPATAPAAPWPWRSTPTTAPTCGSCTRFQERCGLESEWLTGRECRRLEPMLAPGVRGGPAGRRRPPDRPAAAGQGAGAGLRAGRSASSTAAGPSGSRVVRDRAAGVVLADGADARRRPGGARRGQPQRQARGRTGRRAAAGAAR